MQKQRVVCIFALNSVLLLAGCRTPPAPTVVVPVAAPTVTKTVPVVATAFVLPPEGQRRAQALAAFANGRIAELNKDAADAVEHYLAAAQLEPDNEALQMRTAQGLLQQNRNQEALALLRNLAARHPDSDRALLWLALAYQATDQGDKAAAIYGKLLKLAPDRPEHYLKLATILVTQGRDEEAQRLLERALQRAPHTPDLFRAYADLFARTAIRARSVPAAHAARQRGLDVMEEATREHPKDNALLTGLAELYIADGQFAKAFACHASLEARISEQLPFRSRIAQSYAGGGQREAAIGFFERGVQERPQDERAWFYLGELHEDAGDAVRAEIAFRRAAEHAAAPLNATRLAVFLLTHSQTNAALQAVAAGLTRWPENALLLQFQAYLHIEQQAYAQAMADFARSLRALRKKPDATIPAELFSRYAVAAFKAGKSEDCVDLLVQGAQLDDAVTIGFIQELFAAKDPADARVLARLLQKVAARLPANPNPLIHLGFVRYAAQDHAAALRTFEQAQQVAEHHGGAVFNSAFYFWFGASCERCGQFERGEKLLLRCLELEPDHAEALNYLAYMWSEKRLHLDRALEFSRRALRQDPENGAFLDTLGWIFFQLGRFHDALAPLQKAAEMTPEDATVAEHLGDLYLQLNQPAQALKYWTNAYQLDSKNDTLAQKLRAHGLDPAKALLPPPPTGKAPPPAKPAT
jgi:tetratricopeptide (TPR) repeat protein